MAGIPQTFLKSGEGSIASYDYFDIAEGTGIKDFYGFSEKSSGAVCTYRLTTNQVHSASGNVNTSAESRNNGGTSPGTAWVHIGADLDFDLIPFNLPKIVNGKAIINYSMHLITTTEAGNGYWRFRLRKDSGGVETELGYNDSEILIEPGAVALSGCVVIDITRTHFKKGDIIRLTLESWLKHDSGDYGAMFLYIAHSPTNSDTTNFTAATNPTKLEVYIPFVVDL